MAKVHCEQKDIEKKRKQDLKTHNLLDEFS